MNVLICDDSAFARKQMAGYRREQGVNWMSYDDPDRFEAAQSLAAGFLVLQE